MKANAVIAIIGILFAMACVFPASADVHRYEMDKPLLQIYPVNMRLTNQQQHAALYALANDMKARGGEDLADFVRIALYEMAALYEEEAQRSGASEAGKSLSYRWTDSTMSYANDLYRIADAVNSTTSIDVANDDTGELMFILDGRPRLLSSPVLDKPLLLDDRIIDRVCREMSCDAVATALTEDENKSVIIIDADWVVAGNKPPEYVTSDGLHFVFRDMNNRSAKQIACLKLIKEMELLADALRDAVIRGVTIDQDKLVIQSLYGSYDYRVRLNQFGDTLYIKLPELHHVQDWTTLLWPWVRARMEDRKTDHYLQADVMLSYTLR